MIITIEWISFKNPRWNVNLNPAVWKQRTKEHVTYNPKYLWNDKTFTKLLFANF